MFSYLSDKSPVNEAEAMRGERLSNYNKATPTKPTKTSSGSQTYVCGSQTYPRSDPSDMGPIYSQSTLERKKGLVAKGGYASLDRKARTSQEVKERLFGSRSSLNKAQTPEGQNLISSTIISNPHATFSRPQGKPPPGTKSDGEYSPTSPYVNVSLPPGSVLLLYYCAYTILLNICTLLLNADIILHKTGSILISIYILYI